MYPCCKMTPRLDGWWLVSEHDHCTCSPHMGAHEVGCGMTPDVKLDHLPGWDELVTAVTAIQQAEIDRLNATIQRVREMHMESNVCDVREHTLPGSYMRCGDCMTVCTECHRHWEGYPCPTIRALEGGEQ